MAREASTTAQRRMDQFFAPKDGGKKRKAEGEADGKEASSKKLVGAERAEISKAIAMALARTRKVRERVSEIRGQGGQPALKELLTCDLWAKSLEAEFPKKYFENLERFIQGEWKAKLPIFPQPWDIFRALNACPPSKVRVVILGQDPYHNVNQAMGLSFSVPRGEKIPSSLRNIYKELASDCTGFTAPKHGNLEKWTAQGVLLLNAVLTVRAHQAGSHQKKGWEAFTEEVIKVISSQEENVVFMLWGRWAQERGRLIKNPTKHCILKCAHPSGLSAHRGFFGCKHFSAANKYLVENDKTPVDWRLPL